MARNRRFARNAEDKNKRHDDDATATSSLSVESLFRKDADNSKTDPIGSKNAYYQINPFRRVDDGWISSKLFESIDCCGSTLDTADQADEQQSDKSQGDLHIKNMRPTISIYLKQQKGSALARSQATKAVVNPSQMHRRPERDTAIDKRAHPSSMPINLLLGNSAIRPHTVPYKMNFVQSERELFQTLAVQPNRQVEVKPTTSCGIMRLLKVRCQRPQQIIPPPKDEDYKDGVSHKQYAKIHADNGYMDRDMISDISSSGSAISRGSFSSRSSGSGDNVKAVDLDSNDYSFVVDNEGWKTTCTSLEAPHEPFDGRFVGSRKELWSEL